MHDGTSDPAPVPVASDQKTGPAAGRRAALLLGVGGAVGLAVGVVITISLSAAYTTFTRTIPETRDSVEVFNKLNELRQQLNEERKLKEQEQEEVRQALNAVNSAVRARESGTTAGTIRARSEGGGAEVRPAAKPQDGFAEVDEEIERLQQEQKVLNTILDMFSRKSTERAKER